MDQSKCYVFSGGNLATFNDEVACFLPTNLPEDFTCAVRADLLWEHLSMLDEEEIELKVGKSKLTVKGRDTAYIAMEREIRLPVGEIDQPEKWHRLPLDEFLEAAEMCCRCAKKKSKELVQNAVHIATDYIEACDNDQICRYAVSIGISNPAVIRGASLAQVYPLGVTKISETRSWVHFKAPNGLIVSCHKYLDEYKLDLQTMLTGFKEKAVKLPRSLIDISKKAIPFCTRNEEEKHQYIEVDILPGGVRVRAMGVDGRFSAERKASYTGRPVHFKIRPELLVRLLEQHNEVVVDATRLKIEHGKWVYVASLVEPEKVKEEDE